MPRLDPNTKLTMIGLIARTCLGNKAIARMVGTSPALVRYYRRRLGAKEPMGYHGDFGFTQEELFRLARFALTGGDRIARRDALYRAAVEGSVQALVLLYEEYDKLRLPLLEDAVAGEDRRCLYWLGSGATSASRRRPTRA